VTEENSPISCPFVIHYSIVQWGSSQVIERVTWVISPFSLTLINTSAHNSHPLSCERREFTNFLPLRYSLFHLPYSSSLWKSPIDRVWGQEKCGSSQVRIFSGYWEGYESVDLLRLLSGLRGWFLRSTDLLRLLSGLRGWFLRFLSDIFALRTELLDSVVVFIFQFAERIYGITYHISSSPYYSEDIHTDYPRVSLKGVESWPKDNLD
jgi:hypothetical protein